MTRKKKARADVEGRSIGDCPQCEAPAGEYHVEWCLYRIERELRLQLKEQRKQLKEQSAHIHTLEQENGRLRDALVKAEADMVTADATANGRWSEWGDRATWVADKLDEAIEGVRAALAPPAPATREMEP